MCAGFGFPVCHLPSPQASQQLLNAYTTQPRLLCKASTAVANASAQLNQSLKAISAGIQAREASLKGRLPQFLLLDPARMPYYTYT